MLHIGSNVPKSQLHAILTSNCNVVCLYSTVNAACLGGDRLPTLFHSKHIRTSNCYVICFHCNVNTVCVCVCVGGNRLHHVDLKYKHMRSANILQLYATTITHERCTAEPDFAATARN